MSGRRAVGRPSLRAPKLGDRVRVLAMPGDPDPVPAGVEGVVDYVSPTGEQVSVRWDDGRRLMLLPGVDSFDVMPRRAVDA